MSDDTAATHPARFAIAEAMPAVRGVRAVFLALMGLWTGWYAWAVETVRGDDAIDNFNKVAVVLLGWVIPIMVLAFLMPATRWALRMWREE